MAKGDVMHYLSQVSDASATDVGASLGLSLPAAGMALLRLTRSGLVRRTFDPQAQWYTYALTDKGDARLAFFEAEAGTRPVWGRTLTPRTWPSAGKGEVTMKRKKLHTGTYHCPACFIEFDLVAEESLKCDQCGGPLAKGPLEEIWEDDDEADDNDGGEDE